MKQRNIALSETAHDLLNLESVGAKTDRGVIVDALICRYLRNYRLSYHGPSEEEVDTRARVDAIVAEAQKKNA